MVNINLSFFKNLVTGGKVLKELDWPHRLDFTQRIDRYLFVKWRISSLEEQQTPGPDQKS